MQSSDCCRAKGFNRRVREDVIDDSKSAVIIDMPCPDKKFAKVRPIQDLCIFDLNISHCS